MSSTTLLPKEGLACDRQCAGKSEVLVEDLQYLDLTCTSLFSEADAEDPFCGCDGKCGCNGKA